MLEASSYMTVAHGLPASVSFVKATCVSPCRSTTIAFLRHCAIQEYSLVVLLYGFLTDSAPWLRPVSLGGLASRKGFGWLVPLGFDVTIFTPAAYRRRSLQRPLYGNLILRGASCLDAFSTYPYQTRLPGGAPGGTTGTPEVCPTRSSRTSVGSSQISCAHNR